MLKVGIDSLQSKNFTSLNEKRIGLFTNPSAVNAQMVSTYQVLLEADNVNLVALFGAEHGLFGIAQDGATIDASVDSKTDILVHSLYGKSYRPTQAMLENIDLMVCDIQDIGVRYYTYQLTMTHIVEACGEFDVPVLVLDRPNPLGDAIAGCGLDPDFASLVGRFNVPIRHGMTIGEMMLLFNAEWNPTVAQLSVMPCEDYHKSISWETTQRLFVPPSPNMPQLATVKQYPGACLVEGTTLSEGRGTTLPFEIVGAPYIDGRELADALNKLHVAGVRFRPHGFTPITRKYAGESCEGVQVHIMNGEFEPIFTWLTVIQTIMTLYPDDFGWRPPYVEGDHLPFDKLIGSDRPRNLLMQGTPIHDIMNDWQPDIEAFQRVREPHLIYE